MNMGGPCKANAASSQEEHRRELLPWVPVPQPPRESCLGLLADQPHSLLGILDAQTWLSQVSLQCWGQGAGGPNGQLGLGRASHGNNKVLRSWAPAHRPQHSLAKRCPNQIPVLSLGDHEPDAQALWFLKSWPQKGSSRA